MPEGLGGSEHAFFVLIKSPSDLVLLVLLGSRTSEISKCLLGFFLDLTFVSLQPLLVFHRL